MQNSLFSSISCLSQPGGLGCPYRDWYDCRMCIMFVSLAAKGKVHAMKNSMRFISESTTKTTSCHFAMCHFA